MKYDYDKIALLLEDKYNANIRKIKKDGIIVDNVNLNKSEALEVHQEEIKITDKNALLEEWFNWKENN